MKKVFAMILSVAMIATMLVGCGGNKPEEKAPLEGTMEENINLIVEKNPVEFMAETKTLDLADTSEEGKWALVYNTGLESAEKISDAAVFEPMMGSMAFSLVMVRVNDAADAEAVAKEMNENIDTRKWICVEANEKQVAVYGDVIMLIMMQDSLDLKTESYVSAFQEICGAEPDFVL